MKPQNEIAEIAIKARKEGLSYGQWVGLHENYVEHMCKNCQYYQWAICKNLRSENFNMRMDRNEHCDRYRKFKYDSEYLGADCE